MHPELLPTLRHYSLRLFRADLFAGITVAMVALPLSLAIAIASGATPAQGLVTAVVAGFLISALGGSQVQIGGPTGAFIVVVAGVIAAHGYDGLVAATFLAGLILVVAGLLRAGSLIAFVPDAVIHGFTIGIGAIIATSQIKDLFGLTVDKVPADFLHKIPVFWATRGTTNIWALAIGVGTIVLVTVLRRRAPRLPGLIFAITLTSGIAAGLHLPVDTIGSRFGALPHTLPAPRLPPIQMDMIVKLLPSAFLIAFLAGIESLLSAIVADRMHQSRHRPNAELLAQGFANLGSSLFGGLPATGAIARTATNIRAGARTPVAGIVHAATLLIFMWVAAPLAGYLAMPALAGILMLTAWNMTEPHHWRDHLRLPWPDLFLLVLTLLLTLLVDLTTAIGTGVALGLLIRWIRGRHGAEPWTTPDR